MREYCKINSIYKRDTKGAMILGEYSEPAFQYLALNEWVYTEKVDGTNIRIMWDGQAIRFGGRTDAAQIPAFLVDRLRAIFDSQKDRFAAEFGSGPVCLYGEGYGARIQKGGGNYGPSQDFVLFDVLVGEWWLERPNVEDVAEKFGLRTVPILGRGPLSLMVEQVKGGFRSTWGDFQAEGIVARPAVELRFRNFQRIITKLKTRDFERLAVP